MVKFKYFDNPELMIGFLNTETICDICGQEKLCFDAEGFYGTDEIASICAECLVTGRLTDKDAFTCEGDIEALEVQLKEINKTLTEDETQQLLINKTIELETTTPHLVTWQDWRWPCADGDYCKFIGYGSKPFYKKLAKDNSVEDFFRKTFYDKDSYIDNLWQAAVPDKAIKNYEDSNQYGTLLYVFKSLNSDKIITIWDCN